MNSSSVSHYLVDGFSRILLPSVLGDMKKLSLGQRHQNSSSEKADYPEIPVGDAADFAYCDLLFTSAGFESF